MLLRNEIGNEYKWDLSDICLDEKTFNEESEKILKKSEKFKEYSGKIKDEEAILKCLDEYSYITCELDNLVSYAFMKSDEDNTNSDYQKLAGKANQFLTKVNTNLSFVEAELITVNEAVLKSESLNIHKVFLEEILRNKKHTLTLKEERILAMSREATGGPSEIFSKFMNADLTFGKIKNEEGEYVELTKGNFIKFLESSDREVRKTAFTTLYEEYAKNKNMIAASLTENIKVDKFYSKVRNYNSTIEASLDDDNITTDVYDNLLGCINDNINLMHRYVKTRSEVLDLPKVNMYDLYVPIVEDASSRYSYEESCELVINGLSVLGEEYISFLKEGFESNWIDVYESKGKTSGAYSWGTYKTHPYVLLNFNGTLNSVFTLAHEMGHSIHTYYTQKNQTYMNSKYKIFVAEVASTVNEILLLKYMLKEVKSKKDRAYLLNHFLESFRGTVFRQTMFAEFEKIIHESYNEDKPLSCDDLCNIYYELNEKYFGKHCEVDDLIKYEWARIPHFYSSFYVYKYATGFTSAVAIVNNIEKNGQVAVDKYLEFLKSGCIEHPLDLLKKTGVDLTTKDPIQKGMDLFEEILDEFEEML